MQEKELILEMASWLMLVLWVRITGLALLHLQETVDYSVVSKGLARHAWVRMSQSVSLVLYITGLMLWDNLYLTSYLTSHRQDEQAVTKAHTDRGDHHICWSCGVALDAVELPSGCGIQHWSAHSPRWLSKCFVNIGSVVLYLQPKNWQAFTHMAPWKRLDADSNLWKALLGLCLGFFLYF